MIVIIEEEIIPLFKRLKLDFDFQSEPLKNIFDREFWNMKQVYIKGKMHGYSATTRLLFKLYHNETENVKFMKLIAWKNKEGKFIPKNKCNKDILNWCIKSGIVV